MKDIKKLINDIPICDDAKVKVAALIEAIAPGVKINYPKVGEVWLTESERIGIHTSDSGVVQLEPWFPFRGSSTSNRSSDSNVVGFVIDTQNRVGNYWVKKLADNPIDYYKNREQILADLRKELPEV